MRYIAASIVLFLSALPAFAHRLHVDSKVVDDKVRVEVYYDDDTPAQQAKVSISLGDTLILEGRTDDKGVWTCAKPVAGSYLVRVESVGHIAKGTLVVRDGEAPSISAVPDDDDREARTQTPWRKLGLGLGLILGITITLLWIRRSSARKHPTPE